MTDPDIRQFAYLLGRRLDSPEIKQFFREWKTQAIIDRTFDIPAGEIRVHHKGFDIILAFNHEFGSPRGEGLSEVWTSFMRFFSPEYCREKEIVPYQLPIIGDVKLPLTRQEVRNLFGEPWRSRRDARHVDEYEYDDCIVRFCYPKLKEHVAFVELGRHSAVNET